MVTVCAISCLHNLTRVSACGVKQIEREITTWSVAFGIFRRQSAQLTKQTKLCSEHNSRSSRQLSSSPGNQMTVDEAASILAQSAGGSVDLEKNGSNGLAIITLNNPSKKNALTGTMMIELAQVVTELEQWDDGRYVIFRGAGGFFCSGVDLNMVRTSLKSKSWGMALPTFKHQIMSRLLSLPLISVALIEGGALGGGAELTTCCDYRIAAKTARVGFLHVKLGVIPGFGGGTGLTNIIGRKRALDLLASSRVMSMVEAEQIGFVDHIIPDGSPEQSLASVTEWLTTRYPHSTPATRAAKVLVNSAASAFNAKSLEVEKELFGKLWGSPVHRKALGLEADDTIGD